MSLLDTLAPLRSHGQARTTGLADAVVLDFAGRDPDRNFGAIIEMGD